MTTTSIQTDTTTALCARIQAAAIKCDTYHVFVDYAAHTGILTVMVYPNDMDYQADIDIWPEPLIRERVYVDGGSGTQRLLDVVDQLQRLGVEV